MLKIQFATMDALFDPEPVPRRLIKNDVMDHFKEFNLIGVPDTHIRADLEPNDGSDILVEVVDPEESLGTPVFDGEKAYFDDLERQLYEPGEEEIE